MTTRKKLIEVALPLEAINQASAREKSIRHGHPSTLHLWWARRPLAACRAVIFASLVDDPDDPTAPPDFVAACRKLPKGKNAIANDTPRQRLFDFIELLVQWESTTDEKVLTTARELIRLATGGNPPPLLDPFAGGGSIPLEAQRLGLEAHASDLNPVAVMINKAQIEIPPKFANQPPVNPRDRQGTAGTGGWQGAAGLAADVRYYGEWMRDRAWERIGHLYPPYVIARAQPEAISRDGGEIASEAKPPRNDMSLRDAQHRSNPQPYPETASPSARSDMSLRDAPHRSNPQPHPETASPSARNDMSLQAHTTPEAISNETVIAWLWARTVKCPNPACGAQMPLVRSFDLSTKKERRTWVEPQVDPATRRISFVVKQGKGQGPEGTVNRLGATCLACGTPVPFDYIRAEGRGGRIGAQLMAIVTEGKNGRNYYAPTPEHKAAANVRIPNNAPDTDLPEQALGFRVQLYGMTQHRDLFTPRQLVALTTFSDLVAEARQQIQADALIAGLLSDNTPLTDGGYGALAYAEAVSVYLGLGVSKLADYNSTLVVWSQSRDQAKATFARQALPMVWDYAEVNPFAKAAGDLMITLVGIGRTLESSFDVNGSGLVKQLDAADISATEKICISTDPPYYDNIGYADLSDFFYIWLRRSLKQIYPQLFSTLLVPKRQELVAIPYRFNGDSKAATIHFETGLMKVFGNIRRIISLEYPFSVYYAFKQEEIVVGEGIASTGWETMLNGLIEAGFAIVGTWPMRTERSVRSVSLGTNALASSIVLVCRPRPDSALVTSRREFVNTLRQELPPALREMQSGNIAPVDLAQASIGPGMAVYSRYSKVLEPNGERLGVRTALQLINQALDEYLAEQEGEMEADSRFALAWFEQFGFKEAGFGPADVLARAKNTSVEGLANAGVLESGAGKVRLYHWSELDPGWDPTTDRRRTVWEATHHLIERLNTYGEEGAAQLLAKLPPDLAAAARQLAYRLYSVCERKGWAEYARDYNALVISWGASQEQATRLREQYQQGQLFG